MTCDESRSHLLDRRRGRLDPKLRAAVEAHLETCEACRNEDRVDAALSEALARIPQPHAPERLVRSLRARHLPAPRSAYRHRIALAFGAVALVAAAAALVLWKRPLPATGLDPILTEAVNDHLRVLYSDHPIEVASSDSHTVKPWFAGRIDFAPIVAFEGDAEFPLVGGAVGYFIDRKAAVYEYRHKLHVISLFVFRAEGLPWQASHLRPIGRVQAAVESSRGFHVVSWRDGDLGYALVSDMNDRDLVTLATEVAGP